MFYHLHLHTVYSILDGMCKIKDLVERSHDMGMKALAITDHGAMYGCAQQHELCSKAGIKPIYGCEMYVARRSAVDKSMPEDRNGNHLILLAKNETGYRNLCKLNSLAYQIEHFYYKPRIDFEMLKNYHEGLICLTACIAGIVPEKILTIILKDKNLLTQLVDNQLLKRSVKEAVQTVRNRLNPFMQRFDPVYAVIDQYKAIFGEDYYIELQRHGNSDGITKIYDKDNELTILMKEILVNAVLLNMDLKNYVATNDVHFLNKDDAHSHEIQICISTKKTINSPERLMYSGEEYFKSEQEMLELFDPDELNRTEEIVNKIELVAPTHEPQMPKFRIPDGFLDEADYLRCLVLAGATELYLTDAPLQHETASADKIVFRIDETAISADSFQMPTKTQGFYYIGGLLYGLFSNYVASLHCAAWYGLAEFVAKQPTLQSMSSNERKTFLKKFVLYPYSLGIRDFCATIIRNLLSQEVVKRVEYELKIILDMGFPGYFLITWDLIRACREELNILVGPGRGSAAGSIIAYCLYITRIDPLKYNLLFERFLNPDRISLPDIDTDYELRDVVIDYATQLYGMRNVSHIITFSNLLSKSTIADVTRVYDQPLTISNGLKALIPPDLKNYKNEKGEPPGLNIKNCCQYVQPLKELLNGTSKDEKYKTLADNAFTPQILKDAMHIEGLIRGVGVHACGIIIGKSDLSNFVPMATVEHKEYGRIAVTQYDGHYIETMGLIKMDFLGIDNLPVIRKCIDEIKEKRGVELDFYSLPIDDRETYEIFQRGDTIGVFQFESEGMRTYLKKLQPTEFSDLIAMNALYRPGPMAYIPQYIDRKHGARVSYQLPCMEKYLKDTYGITIYQEQVMLLSREIAGFTRGESDTLRKAMGKKKKDLLDGLYSKFINGGMKNSYDRKILDNIWKDWLNFASYAFNKSHAACYAYVAYATAYLKAHYKEIFLSACLTVFGSNRKEIAKFIKDVKASGIRLVLPNINLAQKNFTSYIIDNQGFIIFGLGGLKGLGEGIIESIIKERNKNGEFKDIYDFAKRMDATACGKKTFEILTYAGAFDTFGLSRNFYLGQTNTGEDFFDALIKWSSKANHNHNSLSIFGTAEKNIVAPPTTTKPNNMTAYEILKMEKEYVGIFVSDNPLDNYPFEVKHLCNFAVEELNYFESIRNAVDRKNLDDTGEEQNNYTDDTDDEFISANSNIESEKANEWIENHQNNVLNFAGIVTSIQEKVSKKNTKYKKISIEGYEETYDLTLFPDSANDTFSRLLQPDNYVFISVIIQQRNRNKSWFREQPIPDADYELKLVNIQSLNEIQSSLIDSVLLNINLASIDENFVEEMSNLCQTKKGEIALTLLVGDGKKSVRLANHNARVRIDSEFYNFLKTNHIDIRLHYRKRSA